jgi:hypothetical protein
MTREYKLLQNFATNYKNSKIVLALIQSGHRKQNFPVLVLKFLMKCGIIYKIARKVLKNTVGRNRKEVCYIRIVIPHSRKGGHHELHRSQNRG